MEEELGVRTHGRVSVAGPYFEDFEHGEARPGHP